jgi:hypothetical protein
MQWDFNTINVDPGITFVIQNIVNYLHSNITPIELFKIRSPLVRDGVDVHEVLPCDFEPHPFIVNYARENTQVIVDVDFRDREDPGLVEPFREAWDSWYEVAAHWGFCNEDYPPEVSKIFIEDDLKITSTGIGGVFDDVVIDDAGFYCLINMLQVLHHRLAPIDEVTIE